jgi:hypothetical protein
MKNKLGKFEENIHVQEYLSEKMENQEIMLKVITNRNWYRIGKSIEKFEIKTDNF